MPYQLDLVLSIEKKKIPNGKQTNYTAVEHNQHCAQLSNVSRLVPPHPTQSHPRAAHRVETFLRPRQRHLYVPAFPSSAPSQHSTDISSPPTNHHLIPPDLTRSPRSPSPTTPEESSGPRGSPFVVAPESAARGRRKLSTGWNG